MSNTLVDAILGDKRLEGLQEEMVLSENQKLANIFAKKLLGHNYKTIHVNKEYFRPIYKELKGKDYDEEDMRFASATVVFNDRIKKYYFEK
jgi:hypothetical protein